MPEEQPTHHTLQSAIPLGYEPPQPKAGKDRSLGALVVITLFICGASVGLFAIDTDARRYGSSGAGRDSWPVAVAIIALSAMGTSFGYFVSRRR